MMRAQIFMTDLIFTAAIFATLFFFIAYTTNQTIADESVKLYQNKANLIAYQLSSLLALTPGQPLNWTATNVTYPGLVFGENRFSRAKYDQLAVMNINDTLGIPYPVDIMLEEAWGTPINCTPHIYEKYGGKCTYFDEIQVSRIVYGDRPYRLRVIIDAR